MAANRTALAWAVVGTIFGGVPLVWFAWLAYRGSQCAAEGNEEWEL